MVNPVAFKIFNIEVRWYGILIALGLVFATMVAFRNAKKSNLKEDDILDYILFALPACIIGARLYYVIFQWDYYKGSLMRIINIREGGLAIHGGLIAGFIVGYIYCKVKKINPFNFADIVCTSIPLGQSIGRWGNFTNAEAHGTVTNLPWAINVDGQMVHPTFLYESIWDFLIFIFLLRLFDKRKFDGQSFSLYIILYSIGRFFIEGLRTDSLMFFNIRIAQLISISMIILGIICYTILDRKNSKN